MRRLLLGIAAFASAGAIIVSMSTNVHSNSFLDDGGNFGSTKVKSAISETSKYCIAQGYSICEQDFVGTDNCPENPNYSKVCLPKSNFKYSGKVTACERMTGTTCTFCAKGGGIRWRGNWTQCLD